MGNRFHQGEYIPINPDKYIGTYPIYLRSSWERHVATMFDTNPSIIGWASESVKIPYLNPFTNKYTVYIPDFLVIYEDKNGNRKAEIIEVKPMKESSLLEARSLKDKAAAALNQYKWAAAQAWAKSNGMIFRVLTEASIFNNSVKPKKRK